MEIRQKLIEGIREIVVYFKLNLGLDAKHNMRVCDNFMEQLNGALQLIKSLGYGKDDEIAFELNEARYLIYNKRLEFQDELKNLSDSR